MSSPPRRRYAVFSRGSWPLHPSRPRRRAVGIGSDRDDHTKVAVLVGSLTAALFAAVVLRLRNRRRIRDADTSDHDHDDVPDVYDLPQRDAAAP